MSSEDTKYQNNYFEIDNLGQNEVVFSRRDQFYARYKELKHVYTLLKKSPLFFIGFFIIMFLILVALFANVIAPYEQGDIAHDNITQELYNKLPPMSIDNRSYLFWKSDEVTGDYLDYSDQFTSLLDNKVHSYAVDYTGDGIPDLIVGTDVSTLYAYKGVKVDEFTLNWELDTDFSDRFPSLPSNVTEIAPVYSDLNNDTILDLVIGTNIGRVYISENIGTNATPIFNTYTPLRDFTTNEVRVFPSVENPQMVDVNVFDFDKEKTTGFAQDLIVTSTNKDIYYFMQRNISFIDTGKLEFENTNMRFNEEFDLVKDKSLSDNFDFTQLTGEGLMRIQFTRIGDNDREDLLITFESGDVHYFSLTGQTLKPTATRLNESIKFLTFKFPTIPRVQNLDFLMYDFNNDGFQDLLIFSENNVGYSYQFNIRDGRTHIFGTDQYGGDVLSKIMYALQLDLIFAVVIVLCTDGLGIIIGSISGYYGGWVDNLIMRLTDIFFAFPGIILAMAVAAALGQTMENLAIALIIVGWSGSARLIRGVVIAEKTKLYVEAAKATGLGNFRIIFRHVLPNSIYPIIVSATLSLGGVILGLAALSFLGFGPEAGSDELGRMVADSQVYLQSHPWLVFFPGLTIMAIVLGFNLLGDSLRDIMDPRLRR